MKRPPDRGAQPLLVRRRVRRKRRAGWLRLLRTLQRTAFCCVAVSALVYLVAVALRPVLLDQEERDQVRHLSAAVAAAKAHNANLKRQIQLLKTPQGIEVEARRLGWVRPGEILIQTSETTPKPPAKLSERGPTPPLGAVRQGPGWLSRSLRWVRERLEPLRSSGRHPSDKL